MSLPTRELDIVGTTVLRTGTSKSGNEYTVYEVEARDPATGEVITENLQSLDELTPGVATFALKKYEHRDGRVEYTLMDPSRATGGGGGRSGGLGESVDQLRTRVEKIEQRLRSIEERQSGQMPTPPPIDGAPAAAGNEVDADDIPF